MMICPQFGIPRAYRRALYSACLFAIASFAACRLETPDSFLDGTPDSNELLKTMNVRNNGELWSGVVAGDLPGGVTGVDVKFDDGPWKKAEISGGRWRVFIPTGAEAAAGTQRWQVGSKHYLNLRSRGINGNATTVNFIRISFIKQLNKDINADGYADFVVGAHGYNTFQGRVYIFYGSSKGIFNQVASAANTVIQGETTNNNFGYAFDISDANGDGYADIAAGAYGYNTNQGRAYFFPGSESGIKSQNAGSASAILTGEAGSSRFGASIAFGDINGDGFGDAVIGGYAYTSNQGRAYFFHGSASGFVSQGATTSDAIITGEAANDYFGAKLSLGDVNGDGLADVIIGAYGYASTQGRTYIFLGTATGIASQSAAAANAMLTGELLGNAFGISVSTGDANGDGFAEVIVGAKSYSTNRGRAYVFHGASMGIVSQNAGTANAILTGESSLDGFGASVSLGDSDGDGNADLVVGAGGFNGGANQGRLYLFKGTPVGFISQGAAAANTILTGQAAGDQFGVAVALNDLNGDGYTDILVGANLANGTGRSYVFKGGSSGVSSQSAGTANAILTGESSGNQYGSSVGFLAPTQRPAPATIEVPSPRRSIFTTVPPEQYALLRRVSTEHCLSEENLG